MFNLFCCTSSRQKAYVPIRDATPEERNEINIDRSVGSSWTRKTGNDGKGIFHNHHFTAKDKVGNSYSFSVKLRAEGGELSEVLGIKAFKHTMKQLGQQNAKFVEDRVNQFKEFPVFKNINDKGVIKGVVVVFLGNKKTEFNHYTFLKDGTMLHFSNDSGQPIKNRDAVNAICKQYFNRKEVGYYTLDTHKRNYKLSKGISPGFSDTRLERAKNILVELRNKDSGLKGPKAIQITLLIDD